MALVRCKMCGGNLDVGEGAKVVSCEYCGTTQTVPSADNEKKMNLYNRANRLRFSNEFDKASGIFESIVAEFPEEAEAYWGLCLCKYGVEYVDDPLSGNKIPTCHRASYDSIFDNANFELATEYADTIAKKLYREEAKTIDKIQKGILEIANKEELFDIFICYKETDENGNRTKDSVLAQDIYNALTNKGYKVFFSRITLEDKLGQEYEPYIFSALNSARVMLVIGTSYEHFDAVWVKNEWNRFVELMKNDNTKSLIPCYRDIDAYDMPAEFRNLQGQDMGKLGFLQDLLSGIDKILKHTDNDKISDQSVSKVAENSKSTALTKRGFIFIEDRDFTSADEYFERALDEDAENSRAYIGKFLCEYKVSNFEELRNLDREVLCSIDIDNSKNFARALKYSSDDEIKILTELKKYIKNLQAAKIKINCAVTIEEFEEVKNIFTYLKEYINVEKELRKCENKLEALKRKEFDSSTHLKEGIRLFEKGDYKNAVIEFRKCCNPKEYVSYMAEMLKEKPCIFIEDNCHIFPKIDGTVENNYKNYAGCDTEDWKEIVAVAVGQIYLYYGYIVGLKADGTVVSVGDDTVGQRNIEDWKNISAIAVGYCHTVGLKTDGTVVAVGGKHDNSGVKNWKNISAIAAGGDHTIGLKTDGTVVAVGASDYEKCNVENWKNISAIAACGSHTVGLKTDGTVVVTGDYNYNAQRSIENWKYIVDIAVDKSYTVGLKADGTVVAVSNIDKGKFDDEWKNMGTVAAMNNSDKGECDIDNWEDIVAVYTGGCRILGLRTDGTIVSTNPSDKIKNIKDIDFFDYGKIKAKEKKIGKINAEIVNLKSEIEKINKKIKALGLALFGDNAKEKHALLLIRKSLVEEIDNKCREIDEINMTEKFKSDK